MTITLSFVEFAECVDMNFFNLDLIDLTVTFITRRLAVCSAAYGVSDALVLFWPRLFCRLTDGSCGPYFTLK